MGITLPKGCQVISIQHDGGATGGTSPTIDIGSPTDDDAFGAEVAADAAGNLTIGSATTGASFGVTLTADTEVYAGVGASAATGGAVTVYLWWIMVDDGSRNN